MHKHRRFPRIAIGLVTTVALALVSLTPAAAEENSADPTANIIAEAAPTGGDVTTPIPSADTLKAKAGSAEVTIPTDSDRPITSQSPGGSSSSMAISLPAQTDTSAPQVAADGTVVFTSTDGGPDAAVQAMSSGQTRIETVIHDPTESRRFTYRIGSGYVPTLAMDGSVFALPAVHNTGTAIAVFSAPWARDASGRAVTTHYEVSADSITQVIEPDADTEYPIVADPAWAWMNAAYGAKLNRGETHSLATAAGVAGMCVGLGRIIGPASAVVCGVYGAYLFTQANIADNAKPKECVFIVVAPAPLVERYRDGNCK